MASASSTIQQNWWARLFNTVSNRSLRNKVVLTFLVVTLISIGGITYFNNRATAARLTTQAGAKLEEVARSRGLNIGTTLVRKVDTLESFSLGTTVATRVKVQNDVYTSRYESTAEIREMLRERDAVWQDPQENTALIYGRLNNTLAHDLRTFENTFPGFSETLVTDKYGGLIAASTQPSTYFQANKPWWQETYNGGEGKIYISDPIPYPGVSGQIIRVAIPIYEFGTDEEGAEAETGEVIGVLATRLSASLVAGTLEEARVGETGAAELLLSRSGHLFGPRDGIYDVYDYEMHGASALRDFERLEPGDTRFHSDITLFDVPKFVGHAPVTTLEDREFIRELGWQIIVHQDQAEALALVGEMNRNTTLLAVLVSLIVVGAGVIMGQQVASPIVALSEAMTRFTQGEHSTRVNIKTGDETGTLAKRFNEMADQVSALLRQLESRRNELEERTNQLDANQRAISVIFAASKQSGPDELLGLVVDMIRDQFDLYHVQIYLIDENRENALLREGTGYAGRQLMQQGHKIAIDQTSLVGHAIREGKPVIVENVEESEEYLPNPLLPDTKSELVVPLRLDDTVIGALDAQSNQADTFNRDMVTLFQTMAEQIAFLFENSELLAQVSEQNEALTRFTTQLRTAAELGQRLSTIYEPDELLHETVELIQSRFGFYHAHIYLLDDHNEVLRVRAGSGEVGRVLREREHTIPLETEKSLVSIAARTKERVLVNDVSLESDFLPNPLLPQTRSEVAIPLVVRGRTLGVLDVQDDQADRFQESDVNALNTLAGQVAAALESARLFEELQQTLERTQVRLRINQALVEAGTEEEVLDTILHEASTTDNSQVTLFLIEETDGELHFVTYDSITSGPDLEAFSAGLRFPVFEYSLRGYSEDDIVFSTPNAMTDPRVSENVRDLLRQSGATSFAIVRIQIGDEWLGSLAITGPTEQQFSDHQLQVYEILAERGALALREARLRKRLTRIGQAIDSTSEAIIICDTAGEAIYQNQAFIDLFGYMTLDDFNEAGGLPALHADEEIADEILSTAIQGGSWSGETPIVTKDGRHIPAEVRADTFRDDDGNIVGTVNTYRDITARKQSEQALRQSQAHLETLFESAPISLWEEDFSAVKERIDDVRRQGVEDFEAYIAEHPEFVAECAAQVEILAVNQTTADMVNARDKEELLANLDVVFGPGSQEAFIKQLVAIANDETSVDTDAINFTLDGEEIYADLKWNVLPGYEDTCERVFVAITDLTRQRETELALRESEARNRALVDAIPDLMFRLSKEGEFLDVVAPADGDDYFFIPPEELIGYEVSAAMPIEVAEEVMGYVKQTLETGEPQRFEYELPIGDSLYDMRDFEARLVLVEEDEVLAIVRDITEQRETAKREERLTTILEATPDFVSVSDAEGRPLYMNDAGRKMVGLGPDDDINETRIPDYHPEDVHDLLPEALTTAREEGIWQGENVLVGANGERIPVSQVIIGHESNGEVEYFSTIARDITEQQRLITQLRTAADIAEQLNTLLEPEELLRRVVSLLRERFGLYHAHIYLLDSTEEMLVMEAGSGEVGRQLQEQGHSIRIDHEQSIVARAAREQSPLLVEDTQHTADFMPNPLLPDTRSEAAIPIRLRDGGIIGVLDVQDDRPNRFRETDVTALSTVAGQIASALDNAYLFEQMEQGRAYLRQVIDANPSSIFVKDRAGRYVLANRALADAYETTPQDMVGKTDADYLEDVTLEVAERFLEEDLKVIDNRQEIFIPEEKVVDVDGSVRWQQTIKVPIEGEAGDVQVLGVATDITGRKRAEEATERRLRYEEKLAQSSQALLSGQNLEESLDDVVDHLRTATKACRTYLLRNIDLAEEPLYARQTHEARAPGVEPRFGEPETLRLSYDRLGFAQWIDKLAEGAVISGTLQSLGEEERAVLEKNELHSLLLLPIHTTDGWYGTICFEDTWDRHEWNPEDVRLLRTAAEMVANAIDRAATQAEIQRFADQLRTASVMSEQITSILDPDKLLPEVVTLLQKRFDLYHVHVYLYNEDRNELVIQAGSGTVGRQLQEQNHSIPLDHEQSIVARAGRKKTSVLVENTREAPDFLPNPLLPATASEVAVPLVVHDELLGVLDVQDDEAGRFTQTDVDTLSTLARQIATTLENARLFEQVQQNLEESNIRLQVSRALADTQTVDDVLDAMIAEAGSYSEATVSIATRNPDTDERAFIVRRTAVHERDGVEVPRGTVLTESEYPLLRQVSAHEGFITSDVSANDLVVDLTPGPEMLHGSFAILPITYRNEWIGVLIIASRQPDFFEEHRRVYLYDSLADQGAIALHTAQLFEETQQTAERLREVDRLKSEFLANMSHELRTPLNSIIGYAEIMLMGLDGDLDDETLQDVEAIHENGQHLLTLINDILDLAKIEAGRMSLDTETVQISALFDEVRTSHIGVLHQQKKDLELDVEVESDLPPIEGDYSRLNQVLNNLVSNAIKFTDEGSITLRAFADNGWLCVEVEDTGVGISEADQIHIFERFRQADGSSTRAAEGTGLGLSITHHLVEMHGGTIEVESDLGKGTTFTVRLPFASTEEAND